MSSVPHICARNSWSYREGDKRMTYRSAFLLMRVTGWTSKANATRQSLLVWKTKWQIMINGKMTASKSKAVSIQRPTQLWRKVLICFTKPMMKICIVKTWQIKRWDLELEKMFGTYLKGINILFLWLYKQVENQTPKTLQKCRKTSSQEPSEKCSASVRFYTC